MKKTIYFMLMLLLAVMTISCSKSTEPETGSPGGSPGSLKVNVTPNSATVNLGQTQQFTAQITGDTNTAVTWSMDQDVAWGMLSSNGLYTAPSSMPSPATATIRATSVADSNVSAVATVTIGQSSGGSLSSEEEKAVALTFGTGWDVTEVVDDAIEIGAQAVWLASELNGGNEIHNGTLTQTAPGAETFSYASTPGDKLVVVFSGGPTMEFKFTTFSGYKDGTWKEFLNDYSYTLQFHIFISGKVNLDIYATRQPTKKSAAGRGGDYASAGYSAQINQSVSGTAVYEGETVTLDVTLNGTESGSVDVGWAESTTKQYCQGTASTPSATMVIADYYWNSFSFNSLGGPALIGQNNVLASAGSVTMTGSGLTYSFSDTAYVKWEQTSQTGSSNDFYDLVSQPSYWVSSGHLFKNGIPIGAIQFTGPVVEGTRGPDLELRLNTGERVFMHDLIPPL